MAKKKCRVVFVEIEKELKVKEKAINKDLADLRMSISDLRIFEAKKNGKLTYVYAADVSRSITREEFVKIRKVLRKHLGVKFGGAR